MKKFIFALVAALSVTLSVFAATKNYGESAIEVKDPENTLVMQLKDGDVIIEMYPDAAPKHVARIKELVRQGFYNGLKFHRVIDGFVAQTGDPRGNGTGGSGLQLKAEFNDRHDGKYTLWGQVISGMEYVDNIKKGNPVANGIVENPDKIISLKVLADIQE